MKKTNRTSSYKKSAATQNYAGSRSHNIVSDTNRRKQLAILLLALILGIVMLTGCGGRNSESEKKSSGDTAKTEQKIDKKTPSKEKKKSQKKEKKSDHKDKNKEKPQKKTSSKAATTAKKSVKKKVKSKEYTTCTISISAKRLLSSESADDDIKSLVPANGYLLPRKTVRIHNGDTVKDVLNRTAREHGITVSYKGANYVSGIGGIFEFDGGRKSGWMYSVNGVFPNVACNAKQVSSGDNIEWKYTLNLGNDL